MKKMNKIISMLLAAMMILGAITSVMTVNVFADETESATGAEESESSGETTTADEIERETETEEEEPVKEAFDHVKSYFASPEEKLASMELAYKNGDKCLYVDSMSGEVAYVNNKTGEKLFTNPYDVASSTGNEATKYEILSQIIVSFSDTNGQEQTFTSYEEAAERGQIIIENIKGGIRVEYTIGREQSRILVPRLISMDRFEEMILQPLLDVFGDELYNPRTSINEVFEVQKALSYFMIYSVDKLDISKKEREEMENTFGGLYDNLRNSDAQYARALKKFPIIETMPVYVFDPDASESELTRAEAVIMKYCPEYTFEELEYDHILTEYTSDSANPPVFRMALEYKVEDDGLSVRLPANGIRFNESLYTLESLFVLPYMGAGNSAYEGYNFFPDGSGALFDFQSLNTNQTRAVSGKVYGTDFAYHEITGTYQKTIRYPVFGIVEESVYYTYETYNSDGDKVGNDVVVAGNIIEAIRAYYNDEKVNFCNGQVEGLRDKYYSTTINASSAVETKKTVKRGFVCVIEEGDALASLTTYHAGPLSDYNTIKMEFTPRPKDSYKVEGAVSVGSNSTWTVVSDRKYVGNYKMKYITLSDSSASADLDEEVYDASWFGMAVAYRDYLTNNGIISKLSADEITSDIPLYIETFGAIEKTEKILSIPVTVMAPLTTFDNIETMYEELSAQGMKNINFKLTGYANGGMYSTMPGNLKFEKAVGGNDGFQELLDKANETNKDKDKNFGIFPDFDFAYVSNTGWFDGYSALKHNAQTIDGRYASQRNYSATRQTYENFYNMVISPAYFVEFYEKLYKNYAEKYDGIIGISVSTLGNALNSDFDEDEPYNREDSKQFTQDAFAHFDKNYGEVMTDGGNAYTWKYVDHILNVALDSSRYNFASETVPFIGVVLHGSIKFAGSPLNMEGDLQYAMLKAIENGASPYFILSYQNTNVLKEYYSTSKYYSIRYDIWSDDIINTYSVMNNVLADVQNKYIVGHKSLPGAQRIPDSDELASDILNEYKELLNAHENASALLEKELELAASIARENAMLAEQYAEEALEKIIELYNSQMEKINMTALHDSTYYNNLKSAYAKLKATSSEDENYRLISDLYYVVKRHNTEKVGDSTYTAEYEAYKAFLATMPGCEGFESFSSIVNGAYSNYAKENVADAEYAIICNAASEKISDALAAFKAGEIDKTELVAVIGKYGAACVSKSALDKNIAQYFNGGINKAALEKNISKWYKGITAVDSDGLSAKIDAFKADTATEKDVTDAISAYFFAGLGTEDALVALVGAAEDAKGTDGYAKAKKALVWIAASGLDDTVAAELLTEYTEKADDYNCYLAAVDAIAYVRSCMDMTFDDSYQVYYKLYSNRKYKEYSALIKKYPKTCSEDDKNLFYSYCRIEDETDVLTANKKAIDDSFGKKSVETYIGLLVEYNWMKENRDKVSDKDFENMKAMVNQSRNAVINNLTSMGLLLTDGIEESISKERFAEILASTGAERGNAIAANLLREMQEIYDTARKYVELSEAAIYVLAEAEDYEIKYIEGEEENYLNIDIDDPEMPSVVKEAVEHAQATYYNIEEDGYTEIVDGFETKYRTDDGQIIYRSVKNSNLYFYGTYETGYQYLKMTRTASGNTFVVYDENISKVGEDKDGNVIYENILGEFGKDVYFTIASGKMVYFEQIEKGIFVEKTFARYNGKLVAVRSGVEIYKDGDIYYSDNGDGTYTRYEYNKSVKACYDEITAMNDHVFASVAAVQNNTDTGDSTILDTILNRIEVNERINNRNDKKEVEEEDSKYSTENVVCVVFGNDDGTEYKTVILNYNNYAIKIEYDGTVYTIPAHYFAVHGEGENK